MGGMWRFPLYGQLKVKKAFHYRLNQSSLRLNLDRLSEFFMCKYGAKPAWSELLRSHTRKWQ